MVRLMHSNYLRSPMLILLVALGNGLMTSGWLRADDKDALPPINIMKTPQGIAFAMMGQKPAAPAPTLFVFGGDMHSTLAGKDVNRIGRLLVPHGHLCVSLDIPCHGLDVRPGEKPAGLEGWKVRIAKGENIAAVFAQRVSQVLDYLIAERYTDPTRVVVSGTSRGGFMAIHCAAADPRIRQVIAFAPVTNPAALTEFAGAEKNEGVMALNPIHVADKLVGKPMWIVIGNNDSRVSTDDCLAFAREVIRRSLGKLNPVPVELRLVGTIGHRLHAIPTPEYGQVCSVRRMMRLRHGFWLRHRRNDVV